MVPVVQEDDQHRHAPQHAPQRQHEHRHAVVDAQLEEQLSAPTPSNGIVTTRMIPRDEHLVAAVQQHDHASEMSIIGASIDSRRNITAPIHSCSCSGSRAASRSATPSMPKFAK